MTVRELIKALKRMPQDVQVGWQDHDQSENELNGPVRYAELADTEAIEQETGYKNIGVVLQPD